MPAKVAVLIPGIMGSVLKLGDEVVWPGPLLSLQFAYKKMEELLRPDLQATDCIRSFFISDQYQSLIDALGKCGFREEDRTLKVAAYDWRQSNALSANVLAAALEELVGAHGKDTEISLVAHSMGGLVSRFYLESGEYEDRAGYSNVKRVIFCATPHRGAAIALPLVLGHEKRLFLNAQQVRRLTNDPRYPSAYELLPALDEPFLWDSRPDAGFSSLALDDDATVKALGLNFQTLATSRRFQRRLDLNKKPEHVRYFCFCGTRQTTATHARLRFLADGGFELQKMEREDGGDGTVPLWSSTLAGLQSLQVGGDHGTIYKNSDLLRTLGALLGKPAVLAGVIGAVEVALRDKVVEPEDTLHLTLGFEANNADFDGVLRIERVNIAADGTSLGISGPPFANYPISYKGLNAEKIGVVLMAPVVSGIYRVAFYSENGAEPIGFDELIVQEPATE